MRIGMEREKRKNLKKGKSKGTGQGTFRMGFRERPEEKIGANPLRREGKRRA